MTSSNQNGMDRKYALKEADLHDTNLADDIGVGWKDLARALGFKQAFIDTTEKENNCDKECCIRVLVCWLHKEGEDATAEKIYEALAKIGRKRLAERFPCKPSDPSQNPKAVIHDLEEKVHDLEEKLAKMSAGSKELEAEVDKVSAWNKKLGDENSRQSARIKELEDMIQKNKAVLETVAVAVQEMEKNPEQRREESLSCINSEVQELLQILKGVDVDNTDKYLMSSIDGKNIATVPQQDEVHLLQSCQEQQSLCQGIFDAFIKLIPEVGELKDYNFESISKLCNFTKELKEQEKLFSSNRESLNSLKDNLNDDQTAELEKLTKWHKTYQKQFHELEKLLSMVLFQGRTPTKQGSKPDSSKHSSQLQTHRELRNISDPFCTQTTYIMDKDKKPEEGQVSFGEPQSSSSKELFGATSTIMGQFGKGLKETQGSKHNKSIKGHKEAIEQRQKSTEDTVAVASKGSSTAADQDNEDTVKANRTMQSSEESINVDQETKQSIKGGPSPVIHKKLSTTAPSKPTAKTGPKPTKQGFLRKLSGGRRRSKKWDIRYFELTDTGYLNYYKKADKGEPIHSIQLKGYPVGIDPNDESMVIVKTEERDWKLKAVNFEEACAWRDALLFYSEKN